MMEEMQKAELEKMKRQMRRGGSDPWAVDYTPELADKSLPENETLLDKAKSYSF